MKINDDTCEAMVLLLMAVIIVAALVMTADYEPLFEDGADMERTAE